MRVHFFLLAIIIGLAGTFILIDDPYLGSRLIIFSLLLFFTNMIAHTYEEFANLLFFLLIITVAHLLGYKKILGALPLGICAGVGYLFKLITIIEDTTENQETNNDTGN